MQLNNRFKQLSLCLAFGVAGALIAHASWSFGWLVFLLCLPLIYRFSSNRWQVFIGFFGYYFYGSHDLLAIVPAFYSGETKYLDLLTYGAWVGWSLVLSIPYLYLNKKTYLHYGLTILIGILPPIGLFHWLSMTVVAGEIFPAMGFVGLLMTVALCSAIAVEQRKAVNIAALTLVLLLSLIPVTRYLDNPDYLAAKEEGIQSTLALDDKAGKIILLGVDTRLPHGGNTRNYLHEFANITHLKQVINQSISSLHEYDNAYVVLPEEVIGEWRPAKAKWWGHFVHQLAAKNIYIIAGADIYNSPSSPVFKDAAVMLLPMRDEYGHESTELMQLTAAKLPMPGGNWNLFGLGEQRTAEMDVLGLKNNHFAWINGKEVYFSICYEDFLLLPHLIYGFQAFVSGVQTSKYWISMANNWFEDESMMSFKVQKLTVESYARLYNAKLLRSINKNAHVYKK